MYRINNIVRKAAACFLILIMCVFMMPGRTYAASTAGGISDEWVYTLAYQKKLDLSKADLNIKLTADEKSALKKQAEDEFQDEVDYVFGGVLDDVEEFEQTSGIPLKKDGEYNSEWNSAWNEANPSYENDLYSSNSEYFEEDISPNEDSELYKKLGGDSISKYRLYLRLDLMSYLEPVNHSKISDFDAWKEKTLKFGTPATQTGDTMSTLRYGWGNVGTTEWFERVYDYFNGSTGDDDLTEAVDYMKEGYVNARYRELESELLNEKIRDSLKGVKFDFYVEKVPESEQEKYGIGTTYSRSDADYTVEAGDFKEDSDGTVPEKVFLSTVDFGSSDQYYDEQLTEAVQNARSATGSERDSAIQSLYSGIDDSDLATHLVLYDGASYESESSPHLLRAGTFTNNGSMIWPYASGTSPFQGGEWNFESLAKYEIFGGSLNSRTGVRSRFSFYNDMAYTGINWATRSGYDLYYPEFDSDGNLVSVSKPLMNGIVDPEKYGEITNPVYDQIAEGKADSDDLENIEYSDYSYGKFDKQTFKNQLADADDTDHTIRRYIVKESSDKVKVNGKLIESGTDELILDVTPVGQIMVFDSVEQADAFYEDYDLQINKERSYWSARFRKVKANSRDADVLTVPSATYTNVTTETADISILVKLDGYDADKSLIDQDDMTAFGLTLYEASDDDSSDSSGFSKGSKVKDLSVDENGYADLDDLKPGKYVLVETKNPDGTRCVKSQYELEVRNVSGSVEVWFDGSKLEAGENAIVDNEISKLSVEKKDGSGAYVKGAGLEIIDDETGETVDSWTTAESPHKVAALDFDHSYTLKETTVPSGYKKADDISFSITDGTVKELTMVDNAKATEPTHNDNGDNSNVRNSGGNKAGNDSTASVSSVKTGDSSAVFAEALLFILAAALITLVVMIRRRKSEHK